MGRGKVHVVAFNSATDPRRGDINKLSMLYCINSFIAPCERNKSPNMPAFTFFYRAFF